MLEACVRVNPFITTYTKEFSFRERDFFFFDSFLSSTKMFSKIPQLYVTLSGTSLITILLSFPSDMKRLLFPVGRVGEYFLSCYLVSCSKGCRKKKENGSIEIMF